MQSVKSCCAANFLRHVLNTLFFISSPKINLFLQKMQNFRALGAPPPDPQNSPLIANFWLCAWMSANKLKFISLNPKFLEFRTGLFRIIDVTTAAYKDRFFNS